jgi:hypothetical protein
MNKRHLIEFYRVLKLKIIRMVMINLITDQFSFYSHLFFPVNWLTYMTLC